MSIQLKTIIFNDNRLNKYIRSGTVTQNTRTLEKCGLTKEDNEYEQNIVCANEKTKLLYYKGKTDGYLVHDMNTNLCTINLDETVKCFAIKYNIDTYGNYKLIEQWDDYTEKMAKQYIPRYTDGGKIVKYKQDTKQVSGNLIYYKVCAYFKTNIENEKIYCNDNVVNPNNKWYEIES